MRARIGSGRIVILMIVMSLTPAAATAQLSTLGDVRVGAGFPTGALDEITNPGLSVGAGIAAQLFSRVAIRTDLSGTFLQGDQIGTDRRAPDIRMVRGVVGLETLLRASHFLPITTSISGGWTSVAADSFSVSGPVADPSGREVAAESSLQPTLVVGANVGLFGSRSSSPVITLSAHAVRLFGDESDFAALQMLAPEAGDLSQATYVVARLGVRFGF